MNVPFYMNVIVEPNKSGYELFFVRYGGVYKPMKETLSFGGGVFLPTEKSLRIFAEKMCAEHPDKFLRLNIKRECPLEKTTSEEISARFRVHNIRILKSNPAKQHRNTDEKQ